MWQWTAHHGPHSIPSVMARRPIHQSEGTSAPAALVGWDWLGFTSLEVTGQGTWVLDTRKLGTTAMIPISSRGCRAVWQVSQTSNFTYRGTLTPPSTLPLSSDLSATIPT